MLTLHIVFLDPDGTNTDYFGVIISGRTGVLYEQQCGGTDCLQMSLEGYFIPLGGTNYKGDGEINPEYLTSLFHTGRRCTHGGADLQGSTLLDGDRLMKLKDYVKNIPIWFKDCSFQLKLAEDSNRIYEAWVPISSPFGSGVLVWSNCE